MHFQPRATWSLLVSLISFGTVVRAADSGRLQADLLFPRNETYAPAEWMPIVFAIQNTKLAKYLVPMIHYEGWRTGHYSDGPGFAHSHTNMERANLSSEDPYFVHNFHSELAEGVWRIDWELWHSSCNENWTDFTSVGDPVNRNRTLHSVFFTIKEGGQAVDLVAATADGKTCSEENAAAVDVTGKTQGVPARLDMPDNTCAVVESPRSKPTPCQVKVDSAVAASMTASLRARLCNGLNPPDDCPEDNAAQKLAVAGVACLAAGVGMLGFLA
ncbi:hypothetical protein B0T20DRAFT_411848 [Sordaria brevicollis]|uniref:DUF7136 domain-containing protein n=1 Tax=Sordaria brevicollis TaxID=83679 RepID=A0AAE0PEY0_SORBR|nr:hypothetical protein B0T20DRAFT_411848 [Sordaria brevicollis]